MGIIYRSDIQLHLTVQINIQASNNLNRIYDDSDWNTLENVLKLIGHFFFFI